MAQSEKQENLLRLARESTKEEREKSEVLSVGIEEETKRWEIIVKYNGSLKEIENEEITVEELLAGFAIVTAPEDKLSFLVNRDEIEYMELPKTLIYDGYQAKLNSCLSTVIQPPLSLTGKNVLLAVIDSGIDYSLEDFINEKGSRILYLWDQSLTEIGRGQLPDGFTVGREFTKAEIDEALRQTTREEMLRLVPSLDERNHGTPVTSLAASSNKNNQLSGAAPDTELIIVKLQDTKESGYPSSTALMRGITYCIKKASLLRRPLVINLSFGSTYGSRDGTSIIELFLNEAAAIGRTTICVGCGNEANGGGHFALNLWETEEKRREDKRSVVELSIGERQQTTNVQLWKYYEDEVEIILRSPGGDEFIVEQVINPKRQTVNAKEAKILIYYGVPSPYTTKQELFFVFLSREEYLTPGIWTFILNPVKVTNGNIQFYLPSQRLRNEGTEFLRQSPTLTITNPATARNVISVAAYDDSREAYASFSGRGAEIARESVFWNEQSKPDLSAPGVNLIAASAGGGIGTYTGTSFSTPIVSGAAALLMEWGIIRGNDPYLYGEKVKAYLRKGSKEIRGEERYPNSKIGWGALCVEKSIPRV